MRGLDRNRVSVVLLDADSEARWLTRAALEEDGHFQVVAETGTGAAGRALAASCEADLVLVGASLPDGAETARGLREDVPRARVVLLAGGPPPDVVAQLRAVLAADPSLAPRRPVVAVR